jgi:hypothetical protein
MHSTGSLKRSARDASLLMAGMVLLRSQRLRWWLTCDTARVRPRTLQLCSRSRLVTSGARKLASQQLVLPASQVRAAVDGNAEALKRICKRYRNSMSMVKIDGNTA